MMIIRLLACHRESYISNGRCLPSLSPYTNFVVTVRTSVKYKGMVACPVKFCPYVTAVACSNSSAGFKFHPTVPPCCLSREVKSTAWGEVQTRQTTTGYTSMVEIIETELENKDG